MTSLDQHRRARLRERHECAGCGREVVGYVPAGVDSLLARAETEQWECRAVDLHRTRGEIIETPHGPYAGRWIVGGGGYSELCPRGARDAYRLPDGVSVDGVPCCSMTCARTIVAREERRDDANKKTRVTS